MTIKEVKARLQKIIIEFEKDRKQCLNDVYKQFRKTGSGWTTPAPDRNKMTCEDDCPIEYGKITCHFHPHVLEYDLAKELMEMLKRD